MVSVVMVRPKSTCLSAKNVDLKELLVLILLMKWRHDKTLIQPILNSTIVLTVAVAV